MKKLGKLSINLNKVMKNEELVNLRGGYGSYGSYGTGTCGWSGGSGYSIMCGYNKYTVQYWQSQYGGTWCCDSCKDTSYCGEYFS